MCFTNSPTVTFFRCEPIHLQLAALFSMEPTLFFSHPTRNIVMAHADNPVGLQGGCVGPHALANGHEYDSLNQKEKKKFE